MKEMSKMQLAEAAGVSGRTLRRWLDSPYMQKRLRPYKLKHRKRILPEKVVKIICEHYVIEID